MAVESPATSPNTRIIECWKPGVKSLSSSTLRKSSVTCSVSSLSIRLNNYLMFIVFFGMVLIRFGEIDDRVENPASSGEKRGGS